MLTTQSLIYHESLSWLFAFFFWMLWTLSWVSTSESFHKTLWMLSVHENARDQSMPMTVEILKGLSFLLNIMSCQSIWCLSFFGCCGCDNLFLFVLLSVPAAFSKPMICPNCFSDHVVILPCERRPSTPPQECLDESQQEGASGKFYFGEENSETGTSSSPRTQELSSDHGSNVHSSSRSSEGGNGTRKDLGSRHCYSSLSHTDTNAGSLMGSYGYSTSRVTTPSQLSLSSEYEEHWNLSPRE